MSPKPKMMAPDTRLTQRRARVVMRAQRRHDAGQDNPPGGRAGEYAEDEQRRRVIPAACRRAESGEDGRER